MNLNDCLIKLAVPVDTLNKTLLILNFLGNLISDSISYRNENLDIILDKDYHGYDMLSVTYESEEVLLLYYKEYSCITPLSIFKYKRGYWESRLDIILSSPEFENSFNSRVF